MKSNNKGFIATSLIYSFFLIFISLFIAVIGDYLQNKVLLETTEIGIKDELNAFVDIRSFKVGDMIVFDNGCTGTTTENNTYIIANIDTLYNNVVLYSYGLKTSYDSNCGDNICSLTTSLINTDLTNVGNLNTKNLDNIIFTYDTTLSETYYIGTSSYVKKDKTGASCTSTLYDENAKGCIISSGNSRYRERRIKSMSANYQECVVEGDVSGTIYINASL